VAGNGITTVFTNRYPDLGHTRSEKTLGNMDNDTGGKEFSSATANLTKVFG
jgi:hypothetical protein